MIENQQIGVFNATGPEVPLNMSQVLETCRQVAGSPAEFVWVDDDFLIAQGVTPFTDLPLWLPGSAVAMMQVSIGKALAAGLTFRPLVETVVDTLAWDNTRPLDAQRINGISLQRETEVLDLWMKSE